MGDMAWRIGLGETAVNAHTDAIRNGQETEPFEEQAKDVLINVLHAMRENWEGDDEMDADKILTAVLVNYNTEVSEEEEDNECGQCEGTGTTDAMGEEEECPVCDGTGELN